VERPKALEKPLTSFILEAHMDPEYTLVAHIMVQYSMKAGMKEFKERGEDAVSKELSAAFP
jgi:hypothetical protein